MVRLVEPLERASLLWWNGLNRRSPDRVLSAAAVISPLRELPKRGSVDRFCLSLNIEP